MYRLLLLLLCFIVATPLRAEVETVTFALSNDTDVDIRKFPADGEFLLLGFPCDQGTGLNEAEVAELISAAGIEVWMADLLSAHFLSRTPESIRSLDGKNVQELISLVTRESNKTIVLITSGYGSVPVLRGVNRWRKQFQGDIDDPVHGAIFFYPFLQAGKPEPGEAPEYLPVVAETALNITIYQPEKSPSKFRLKHLTTTLEKGGSHIETTILPGVRNNFYRLKNPTPEERVMTYKIPRMIIESIKKMEQRRNNQ